MSDANELQKQLEQIRSIVKELLAAIKRRSDIEKEIARIEKSAEYNKSSYVRQLEEQKRKIESLEDKLSKI